MTQEWGHVLIILYLIVCHPHPGDQPSFAPLAGDAEERAGKLHVDICGHEMIRDVVTGLLDATSGYWWAVGCWWLLAHPTFMCFHSCCSIYKSFFSRMLTSWGGGQVVEHTKLDTENVREQVPTSGRWVSWEMGEHMWTLDITWQHLFHLVQLL